MINSSRSFMKYPPIQSQFVPVQSARYVDIDRNYEMMQPQFVPTIINPNDGRIFQQSLPPNYIYPPPPFQLNNEVYIKDCSPFIDKRVEYLPPPVFYHTFYKYDNSDNIFNLFQEQGQNANDKTLSLNNQDIQNKMVTFNDESNIENIYNDAECNRDDLSNKKKIENQSYIQIQTSFPVSVEQSAAVTSRTLEKQIEFCSYDQMVTNFYGFLKEIVLYSRDIDKIIRQLQEIEVDKVLRYLFLQLSNNQTYLSSQQLYKGLSTCLQIDTKSYKTKLLALRYGNDKQQISYYNFCQLFSTSQLKSQEKYEIAIDDQDQSQAEMDQEMKNLIRKLFITYLNFEAELEHTLQLWHEGLYNITFLFEQLSSKKKGYVSEPDIADYFAGYNFLINSRDAYNVLHKFDKNKDFVIDLKEFVNSFKPQLEDINLLE